MRDVAEIFGPDGELVRRGFVYRPGQEEMAAWIEASLSEEIHAACDAPTGAGKSLAYSVPALARGRTAGRPVIISTATLGLQSQLRDADLPTAAAVLGIEDPKIAVVRGRSNYACLARLDTSLELDRDPANRESVDGFRAWVDTESVGDVSESAWSTSEYVRQRFTTSSRDCAGHRCEWRTDCFAEFARQRAEGADVVVASHALLAADMLVRARTGSKSWVLPPAAAIVVDEAHHFAAALRAAFGDDASHRSIERIARRLPTRPQNKLIKLAIAFKAVMAAAAELDDRRQILSVPKAGSVLEKTSAALGEASAILSAAAEATSGNDAGELEALARRGAEIASLLDGVIAGDPTRVSYAERGNTPKLVSRLIDPAVVMQPLLRRTPVVAVSATLTVAGRFDHLERQLGVPADRGIRVRSSFDLRQQLRVVVPTGAPNPKGSPVSDVDVFVLATVKETLERVRGGVLVLCTSNRRVNLIGDELGEAFAGHEVLVVGRDGTLGVLAPRFRDDVGSVLVASRGAFTGIDIPGPALAAIVLDRLPFAEPTDPLGLELGERAGPRKWIEVVMPEAARALRQAVGRIVRREDDFGVAIICDPRLLAMQDRLLADLDGVVAESCDLAEALSFDWVEGPLPAEQPVLGTEPLTVAEPPAPELGPAECLTCGDEMPRSEGLRCPACRERSAA